MKTSFLKVTCPREVMVNVVMVSGWLGVISEGNAKTHYCQILEGLLHQPLSPHSRLHRWPLGHVGAKSGDVGQA